MGIRKYASDYRLETHILPNGKAERTPIYQGPRFAYKADEASISRLSKQVLLSAVLTIVGLLPLLFNNSLIGRTFYVAIPMAFSLLPWYLVAVAGWRVGKFKTPLTREQRDQTDKRLRASSLWLCILVGVTAVGCVVYWILSGLQSGEWLSLAGVGLSLLCSVYLLHLRGGAATVRIEDK